MRLRTPFVATLVALALSALIFQLLQRQLSKSSFAFGAHPEVLTLLEGSLEDQKQLARLDEDQQSGYRDRFTRIESTLHRLQILEHSREDLIARYESILLAIFGLVVLGVGGGLAWRQAIRDRRLEQLKESLAALASGETVTDTGISGRGTIAKIAAMIEETSRRIAGDRQRLAMFENLSAWQEAARRHAHEMRTPLTGLRLEFSRLAESLGDERTASEDQLKSYLEGARHELERLAEFTHRFSSFARLPRVRLSVMDLPSLLREIAEIYSSAWPNLQIQIGNHTKISVAVDRDMLRQVLVNLWDNSAAAAHPDSVVSRIEVVTSPNQVFVDVTDSGPGIDLRIRDRLFQPYTTTKTVGEGMGLGLSISKKILLDHGGDLLLFSSSTSGTTFRLQLPLPESLEIEPATRFP